MLLNSLLMVDKNHRCGIMEEIERKKQATTLTDQEIIKIDEQIRESKVGKRYTSASTSPDDIVRCLNQLNDNLGLILVEVRRMCDILSYQIPKQKEE